jgi:curli production assembly/transport component CsgG
MITTLKSKLLLLIIYLLIITGCTPFYYQPIGKERTAKLGPETPLKKKLLNLPEPKEPIVVAVYKFQDQTGQYKPSNAGSNWSTAVTQGATNILIRVLEESGWFIPIERENISNLLNERKIIRSSRQQYEGSEGALLPPLLFAGILLEGGIVSYETNTFTGGAGVRYFGTNASAQYREDRVNIYLRAVSTSNGKILKTVYTTKSILSQEVTAGVFRYVKFKKLLEAEVGYTYNEPGELAITEAIEKAVQSLIIEGVIDNLWLLKNENEKNSTEILNYLAEKDENLKYDVIGRPLENNKKLKGYFSTLGSANFYLGDYSKSKIHTGGSIGYGSSLINNLYLETNLGMQYTFIDDLMISQEYFADLNLSLLTNYYAKLSPVVSIGLGSYFDFREKIGASEKYYIPYFTISTGLDWRITDRLAITGKGFINGMFSDYYDNVKLGAYNDYIWGAKLGLKIYW